LQSKFDKKKKLAIEDRKVRDKLENLKIKMHEQERELKYQKNRQTELKDYKQTPQHYEDLFKQRQHQEQLEKDRYDHEAQI
jgi:hypothetical protein